MYLRRSIMAVLLTWFVASDAFAQPIEIPVWKQETSLDGAEVLLGYGEINRAGWGEYSPNERKYFQELLPCNFERTLALDSMDWSRGIDWVFTGPRAGFNIEIRNGIVTFYTRYYDSKGFDQVKTHRRYPHLSSPEKTFQYTGELKAVTVKIDYRLQLSILLNGKPVHSKMYLPDIRRHQIRLVGKEGKLQLRMLKPKTKSVNIDVDDSKAHQEMLGWGGIGTPTAYHELSRTGKSLWWQYVCEYNLLCQREYPVGGNLNEAMDNWDKIEDAKAHYYGDNFPNGEITDFSYNKMIQDLGGFVMFEFWDFPKWIGSDENKYVSAMINYCRNAKEKTGKPPLIVGVQNERQLSENAVKRFVPTLRRALDEAGFREVKIHMSNASTIQDGMQHIYKYINNKRVWDVIDYAAINMYDYQDHFQNPDEFDTQMQSWRNKVKDKPFISTELCINQDLYQVDSYRVALTMGQLYHKNLTIMDAIMICYCWTILNIEQPSFGYTRSLFVTDPENGRIPRPSSNQLRVFGSYSRRVKRGMIRVEANSGHKDVLATAFKRKDGKATLVILNRSTIPVRPALTWPGVSFDIMEITDPYNQNTIQSIKVQGEAEWENITIQPGAIVTLTSVPLNRLPKDFVVEE